MTTCDLIHYAPETPQAGMPPLLFVHGAWHGAWCWSEHWLPYLAARGYRCYALNLRGHGVCPSRTALRWRSIADYVQDVQQAMATLPETPILVGHSMGGHVVQKLLEVQRVPAAVLVAPTPARGAWGYLGHLLLHHPGTALRMALSLSLDPLAQDRAAAAEAFFTASLTAERRDAYLDRLEGESFRVLLDSLLLDLPNPRRMQRVPMLVLAGDADRVFPVEALAGTAAACHAELVRFPGMGHDLMLEAAWSRPADALVAWLQRWRAG
jgi:pimeloyl-ACP methyl ester carboxylesterase